MTISVFDLFKIGIGPSSSHTVGPMIAARTFVLGLHDSQQLQDVDSLSIELYGSLGSTGKGHGTDKAVMLGLMGKLPDTVDVESIPDLLESVHSTQQIALLGAKTIDFNSTENIVFYRKKNLDFHANGMIFKAFDRQKNELARKQYYSVGGGFIIDDAALAESSSPVESRLKKETVKLPYRFDTAEMLLELCKTHRLSISEIMLQNELSWQAQDEIEAGLLDIWQAMQDCVKKGCTKQGVLPGGLNVKRRAAELCQSLKDEKTHQLFNQGSMDWVNLYALAVNEENAAGGRVVTAPTNGAAGIIPAVMHYYVNFCDAYKREGDASVIRFLLTAAAIGLIIKENASISGAEVGCQGEVGSACAMAAGALTEVLGGTPEQVENAAEIGIEHNLGLTCDPIGGLVQIPCIERNAMGAVKAINASRMALRGDGSHYVSLDKVINTMRETGKDMRAKYKETARGGLALQLIEVPVNIVEC